MPETRERALSRNVIAILHSLDRHEIEPISDTKWRAFRDDPHRSFLKAGDEQQDRLWAAVQRRLPAHLREQAVPPCKRCQVRRVFLADDERFDTIGTDRAVDAVQVVAGELAAMLSYFGVATIDNVLQQIKAATSVDEGDTAGEGLGGAEVAGHA